MTETFLVKMSHATIVAVTFFCLFSFSTSYKTLNTKLFNGDYNFVDLTYAFDNKSIYWPDSRSFKFIKTTQYISEDGSWYSTKDFAAGEHGGTHIDATYHYYLNGLFVDQIPLDKLIVPLIIADLSSKVNGDPNFILYKRHLDYILNGKTRKPCLILFKFGWGQFVTDKKAYLGSTNDGQFNFPGISGEVAEWITSSHKNVVGVGVDTASIDPGSSTDFPAHKTFAKAGLYMIENVNFQTGIPEYGCTALVMPMKIANGTGAPLRLVAICPKQSPKNFSGCNQSYVKQ